MAEVKSPTTRVPKLRVSDSVKRSKDFEHTKLVMDNYITSCTWVDEMINPNIRDVRLFYEAYNNKLPDEFFRYVTNPLNSNNPDYTNWPAKIRPFTIIRPKIDLLQGEYEKRPFSWTIKIHNQDAVNQRQDAEYAEILQSLQQQFINTMAQKGADVGQPQQEVELPSNIKAKFQSNYKDQRAIMGEAALDIIMDEQWIEEKCKKLFNDWLIAGEVRTYKGMRGGRMVYERVSPLDLDYDKSPDNDYIEDGQWACRRIYLTPADVNDMFYEELKTDEIDLIEDQTGHLSMRAVGTGSQFTLRDDEDLRRSKVVVYHVVWKYMIKVGVMTYLDEFGQPQQIEVPETYKATEGEDIEWFWVNEVWEGYRIGGDIYVGIGPIPNQRNSMNNMSSCKLPYNGRQFSDVHAQNTSPVEMGMPYEILHRILHWNLEKTIAKSKGKIILMDQNALPKKHGWDEEKFFYWADANGWALIDRNQPGADKNFNQYTVLDMGLYQHISELIQLMQFVKDEWAELLGVTRQREGEVKASDTARGTQAAIMQSAVISERIYSKFEEFVEKELRGLLDVSKLAWIDGYQALYQGDDTRNAILQIDPGQYIETDFGVYVSRSARDIQNLEMVRQQVQAFAQNGVSPSTIIDVVQARSLSKLRSLLQEAEMRAMESQQGQQAAEQEGIERIEMIKGAYAELQAVLDEKLMNAEYDRKEQIEHIKGAYSTYKNVEGTGDNNNNGMPDALEVRKQFSDESDKSIKNQLQAKKIETDDRNKNRELDIKERELSVRKQIADKQASVALKNKVVGEKSKPKKK